MAFPKFTLRQLLEAGVHFGHQTQRWNPEMAEFIHGERNGIHILDLTQTIPMLDAALMVVRDTVARGGRVLFVGTKPQAVSAVKEAAERSAQYYVNHRWLGGTLTNWATVALSITRLRKLDEHLASEPTKLTKKQRLGMERDQLKLQLALGGIREMGGPPDLIFVVDVVKEGLAVAEANKLKIPVVAVVDTVSSLEGVDYPIPGNDDARRAIYLYCDLVAAAALDGMAAQLASGGSQFENTNEALAEEHSEIPLQEFEIGPEIRIESIDRDVPMPVPEFFEASIYLDSKDEGSAERITEAARSFLKFLGYQVEEVEENA